MIRQRAPGGYMYMMVLTAGFLVWLGGSALALSIITRTDITPFYSLSEVMAAKRGGSFPAEVHGAPSPAAGPEAILAPLRLPTRAGGGHLIPVSPGAGRPDIRMVLLFNAKRLSARTACREPEATGARPADGGLEVFAVLCRGGNYFSQAHLRDGSVQGETDPGYARSMMQLFLALMPSRDEVDRDSGDKGRN
jgi:hypothetical protein